MRTIEVDDETYTALQARADAEGKSVESWIREKVAPVAETASNEDLAVDERLHKLFKHADSLGIKVDGAQTWSRDVIYED